MHFAAVFHTGPIVRLSGVWLQNPCGGTRCACFRDCARAFRGGRLRFFLRESVFWRIVLQLFRQTGLESAPTLQGSSPTSRGQDAPKKFTVRPMEGEDGEDGAPSYFLGGFFLYRGVASSCSAGRPLSRTNLRSVLFFGGIFRG